MPGPHIPPAVPMHQGRRQPDHPYYHHQMPPQTHSPVPHNPYAPFHHPQQHYGPPHAAPYPQQMPHWYNPYHHHQPQPPPQPQYTMPPRQFQPHGSPVVVSSVPHMAPMAPPVSRALGQTPPIVHSRTPPAPRIHTPQPAPSTPSVNSQPPVSSPTPPTDMTTPTPPPSSAAACPRPSSTIPPPTPQPQTYKPFYPDLPWLSVADAEFPPRASHKKKRRRAPVSAQEERLALPSLGQNAEIRMTEEKPIEDTQASIHEELDSQTSTVAGPSETEPVETPSTSHPPSEAGAVLPSVASPSNTTKSPSSGTTVKHGRTATKPAVPLIPIRSAKAPSAPSPTQKSVQSPVTTKQGSKKADDSSSSVAAEPNASTEDTPKASPPKAEPPKSWADLLRDKAAAGSAQPAAPVTNGVAPTNGVVTPKSDSLADVLASFSVNSDKKLSFLEPRGLVNTGNLCYMNSILQVLLFCVPFYDFLDQFAKRAKHSFKSETPLVDAMIMFLHDFRVIHSAVSVEQLRKLLKDNELEQYGDPLTPEYVYDAIKRLPRFDNMKRGQQEDAEEFLGFLLSVLHDECAHVIKNGKSITAPENVVSPKSERSGPVDGGWLEVGPKQKAAVTQSSGVIEIESPITKIFGGKLRSEYKRPGEKASVTSEPYQPLQLDIGSPNISNISDALKNLTHLESLDSSVRGGKVSTKQVFIETLPPVLILHLKRFHYDAKGPQKIWKKVGYPLELEIPKEVFPQHQRSTYNLRGLPRYRLLAVVYHHGKNASGGHYTVDLRRQEGREWIRMDDTVIRRIRPEDVAEGGSEEDPKVLAAALEQHKKDAGKSKNIYEQMGVEDDEEADKGGWSKVNATEKQRDGTKKWSGVVNGTATPSSAGKRTPVPKENVKDNKVAYILFYQRIGT